MSYIFEHIQTITIDSQITGNTETTETTFKCEGFLYYAYCFQGILQYVKGERPDSYLNWSTLPTSVEIQGHEDRRHAFNQDHSIVQSWLDTL